MLTPGMTVGEFEVTELLGEGGMGAVYLARQTNAPKHEVAIKTLRSPDDSAQRAEFRRRFKTEVEALIRGTQHPHIVRMYLSGNDDDGEPYLVMERLVGEDFQRRLDRSPARHLPAREVGEVVLAALDALAHMHDRGIVHRDIKPSNIMLARDATGREVPKLIDFGLARDLTRSLPALLATGTNQRPGTLRYMAPEQARGQKDVDARADLYAAGVVLYVALSGAFPHDDGEGTWLDALKEGRAIVPLWERDVGVSRALVAVAHRALEHDPARRFQSAGEMREALRDALSGPSEGERFGAYRLIREIGRGGMGVVYEAEHVALGKRVAVKLLAPELARRPEDRARFEAEGRAAARVKHDHIVAVTDAGAEGDRLFLAMEFLEGESLRERLKARGRLSVQEAVDLLLPVCDAVATAHRAGVIHRDLTPANLFLERRRDGDAPKVLDFGIAKLRAQAEATGHTRSGALLGTPYYLAPELIEEGSRHATPASDQFALGAILYECLTGKKAFGGDTAEAVIASIVLGKQAPLTAHAPEVPRAVVETVSRALATKPEARFRGAWELARALLPHASGEVQARWRRALEVGLDETDEATTQPAKRRGRRVLRGVLGVGAVLVVFAVCAGVIARTGGARTAQGTPAKVERQVPVEQLSWARSETAQREGLVPETNGAAPAESGASDPDPVGSTGLGEPTTIRGNSQQSPSSAQRPRSHPSPAVPPHREPVRRPGTTPNQPAARQADSPARVVTTGGEIPPPEASAMPPTTIQAEQPRPPPSGSVTVDLRGQMIRVIRSRSTPQPASPGGISP